MGVTMTDRHAVSLAFSVVITLALVSCNAQKAGRTTNTNSAYGRWNRTSVPYYIDPAFSNSESNLIRVAINTVMTDLNFCVAFTEVPSMSPLFKIKFTPLVGGAGSKLQSYCYSYPGVDMATKATGTEQILSIARGASGCLDGSLHGVMKYVAMVLGKRNEHQRGDRDSYITVKSANVAINSAYAMYRTSDAYWNLFPYDYCSITHNQPTDFAVTGTTVFTVKAGTAPGMIPKLDHLSLTDCKLISMLYGCDQSACNQAPCSNMATSTTGGSSTTAVSTKTGSTASKGTSTMRPTSTTSC